MRNAIIQSIEQTQRCSTERANEIEMHVNWELHVNDINYKDMYPEGLRKLMQACIWATNDNAAMAAGDLENVMISIIKEETK